MSFTKIHQKEFYPGLVVDAGGLNIGVKSLIYSNKGDVFSGIASFLLTDDATNYVMLDTSSPEIVANITGFVEENIALAEVITASGDITEIIDRRGFVTLGGSSTGGGAASWKQGVPTGDIDGVNAEFTLPDVPDVGSLTLSLDGMVLNPGASNDYELTGKVITMSTAPNIGSVLVYQYTVSTPVSSGTAMWKQGTPTGDIDGVNDTFSLPDTPDDKGLSLILDGLYLTKDVDYSLVGDTITMIEPPLTGSVFTYSYTVSTPYSSETKAEDVSFVPYGSLTSENVQNVVQELEDNKNNLRADRTANSVLYIDSTGEEKELSLGADGTFLKSKGAGVIPEFSEISSTVPSEKIVSYLSNLSRGELGGLINDSGEIKVTALSNIQRNVIGPTVDFRTQETSGRYHSVASLGKDKFVLAYVDTNSLYGYTRIGTISNTTITLGTPQIFEMNSTRSLKVVHIDEDKYAVCFERTATDKLYAVCATVSGTVSSFGTTVEVVSSGLNVLLDMIKIATNKVIVLCRTSLHLAVCFSVSGTTITAGTGVNVSSYTSTYASLAYLQDNLFLVSNCDGSTTQVRFVACNVSGNTINLNISNTITVEDVTSGTFFYSCNFGYRKALVLSGNEIRVIDCPYGALCIASPALDIRGYTRQSGVGGFSATGIKKLSEQSFCVFSTANKTNGSWYNIYSYKNTNIVPILKKVFGPFSSPTFYIDMTEVDKDKYVLVEGLKCIVYKYSDIYGLVVTEENQTSGNIGKVILPGGIAYISGTSYDDLGKTVFLNGDSVSLQEGEPIGKIVDEEKFFFEGLQ